MDLDLKRGSLEHEVTNRDIVIVFFKNHQVLVENTMVLTEGFDQYHLGS